MVALVRTAEYDAFGPWIDEVRTEDEIPRLYRDRAWNLGSYRLVLKVPRNISRRDATPDMDLYDHVLAVGPELLTVLSRHGAAYDETTIAYDEIAAIEDRVDLLDGRLALRMLDGSTVAVGYSGSSHLVVSRLVALLRELSSTAVPADHVAGRSPYGPAPALGLRDLGDHDVDLVTSYLGALGAEPGLEVLAAHGRSVLTSRGGLVTRLLHRAFPMTLQGTIVCGDDRELQVFARGDWLVRGALPVHSIARTIIPLRWIDQVTVLTYDAYEGVSVVQVRAGATVLDLPMPAGSLAEQVLAGLRAPSSR
jgi:hypothetical protein